MRVNMAADITQSAQAVFHVAVRAGVPQSPWR